MKSLILPALVSLLAFSARADVTITQQLKQEGAPKGGGTDTTMTMKIKGDKMRMDGIPAMSSIVDLKTGDVTTLLHEKKATMTIPGASVKAMQDQRATKMPKIEAPTATGKKETISGFACEEYTTSLNGTPVSLWLTKDLPAMEKMMQELAKISATSDPFQAGLLEQKISGYPMRTVMEMPGAGKITMTVVAVSEDSLKEEDFKVPSDYKAMPMPSIPGMQ